jgi:preprotein translocase subunit SecE
MAKAMTVASDERAGARGNKLTQGATGIVERSVDFLKDVRSEMHKVVTPSAQEVRTTTIVVILAVFAFAAYFYAVDQVLGRAIQGLLHWLGTSQ